MSDKWKKTDSSVERNFFGIKFYGEKSNIWTFILKGI